MNSTDIFRKVFRFYYDGFRQMTLGRTLWLVILVKLFVIFAVLKLFFFPDYIGENAGGRSRADFVATQITDRADTPANIQQQ